MVVAVMEPDGTLDACLEDLELLPEVERLLGKGENTWERCACCGSKLSWPCILEARHQGKFYCVGRTCARKAAKEGTAEDPVIVGLAEMEAAARKRAREKKEARVNGAHAGVEHAAHAHDPDWDLDCDRIELLTISHDDLVALFMDDDGHHTNAVYAEAAATACEAMNKELTVTTVAPRVADTTPYGRQCDERRGRQSPESERYRLGPRYVFATTKERKKVYTDYVQGIFDEERSRWRELKVCNSTEKNRMSFDVDQFNSNDRRDRKYLVKYANHLDITVEEAAKKLAEKRAASAAN